MAFKINLVSHQGETSVYVDGEINDKGDLCLSGQDIGKAPSAMFGDSDYEYWLTIAEPDVGRFAMALLEQHYSGNTSVVADLVKLLQAKDIPYRFDTYV